VEIAFRDEPAGQTNILRQLLGRQKENFILRRGADVTRFDLHEAEATSPIAPATGTNQKTRAFEDFLH
jgi:hypothetical protein